MKTPVFLKLIAALFLLQICLFAKETHNNLYPNGQIIITPNINSENIAASLLGEFGKRNYRGSGTLGFNVSCNSRLKLSGEFLAQKLKYDFFGHEAKRRWVSQYALGGEYQYLFRNCFFQSIEFGAAYTHAYSKKLTKEMLDPITTLKRHIAGSDGALTFLGTTVAICKCTFISLAGNYDYVKYHRKFAHDKLANGFGGSVGLIQQFGNCFEIDLGAEFRKPFNYYEAVLDWFHDFCNWGIDVGLYGNYTHGKKGVPNVFVAGVQLGFSIGPGCCTPKKKTPKNCCYARQYCDLAHWTSKAAIRVPVVLAIADPKIIKVPCCPVTSTPLGTITVLNPAFSVPAGANFASCLPLTFTTSGLPAGVTINPSTGTITGTFTPPTFFEFSTTVIGTSFCGSSSQPLTVELSD